MPEGSVYGVGVDRFSFCGTVMLLVKWRSKIFMERRKYSYPYGTTKPMAFTLLPPARNIWFTTGNTLTINVLVYGIIRK